MPVRAPKTTTHLDDLAYAQSDDPLTRALAPPPDETPAARAERLRAEAEAKRVSDMIDEELNRQRIAERKGPRPVKILLLGQSESGKSTTLKNFQLMNSPKAFRAERLSWRAVIQLNVVRSVRLVLDAILDAHLNSGAGAGAPPDSPPADRTPTAAAAAAPAPAPAPELLALRARLLPLLDAEARLIRRLMPVSAATGTSLREIENVHGGEAARRSVSEGSSASSTRGGGGGGPSSAPTSVPDPSASGVAPGAAPALAPRPGRELSVTAGSAWKTAFAKILPSRGGGGGGGSGDDEFGIDWADARDPTRVLNAHGADLVRMWGDAGVRALLRAQKLRLEEMPGFFLDELERITALQYVPSDDDILRARLKTLGVTEYRFTMKAGNTLSHDWRVYDVGGQRSLVPAWVPFFDDMNAIIFLAPISCFDQVLMEDNAVNRLEDSVLLWKSIVANPLLAATNLVLFLNKCDVLRAKLAAGIRLGKYVISYGDRPNDFQHASDYLRRKFFHIHQEHSPKPRPFYSHFTSVTDTKATGIILENVTDMVVRANLKSSALIG